MKKYSSITGYKDSKTENDSYSNTGISSNFTYNENSYKKDCENRKIKVVKTLSTLTTVLLLQ